MKGLVHPSSLPARTLSKEKGLVKSSSAARLVSVLDLSRKLTTNDNTNKGDTFLRLRHRIFCETDLPGASRALLREKGDEPSPNPRI